MQCTYYVRHRRVHLSCRGKARSFNYFESVSLFLPSLSETKSHLIYAVLRQPRPPWIYHILTHYLINDKFWEKMCFDVLYNFWLEHFSFQKEFSEI
jgi:hypothetical protein